MAFEEEAKLLAKKKAPKPAPDGDDAGEGDDEEMGSYDSVEDSAADELATLSGVEDKAAYKSALRDYVKACVERALAKD
jgi:hypothetical protein